MMERWSYKPEVEGLSPSLGTNFFCNDREAGTGDREKGDRATGRCIPSFSASRFPGFSA